MSQPYAEALSWVPKSRGLATTLARAFDYAKSQSHRTVTLEHLLLALVTDSDASAVLQACHVDLERLNSDATSYLAGSDDRLPPDDSSDPVASPDLLRIVEYATAAAKQSRRREVNGAIVLAAIVGDGRSPSASMLRDQGLTFEETIKALQKAGPAARNPGQPPSQSVPDPQTQAVGAAPQGTSQEAPYPAANSESGRPGPPREPQSAPAQRNGVTGLSTEEILAAARRRVGSGLNGGARPEASATAAQPESAPEQSQIQAHPEGYYPPQPQHSGSGRSVADDIGHEPTHKEEQASPSSHRPRSDGPFLDRQPAPMGPSHSHGAEEYASSEPEGAYGRSRQAPRQPDPFGPPPAPRLDWPSHSPQADGYYQPQTARGPHVDRSPPPPPIPPQPRQVPPRTHQAPPPRYPGEAPRPAQPPWSEPPQQIPLGAPPPPSGRPSQAVRRSSPGAERPATTQVAAGQLVENIPRTMMVGVPELVEVSIAKAEVTALAERLQGSGTAYRHELVVTKAMSVRLRAPEGGFWIETASPETQWIENKLGLLSDDYASWRWTVTPQRRGRARLQLIVSARTVGADGLVAETALPDQVIEVKVRTNYARSAAQWGGWIAAAVLGGLLARFGEGLWEIGSVLLMQIGLI